MKRKFDAFLDFTKFGNLSISQQTQYITTLRGKKKCSPFRNYIFKIYNFNIIFPNDQKAVIEAFHKISDHNNQHIRCYNHFSLTYEGKFTPIFSMKYISSTTLADIIQKYEYSNYLASDFLKFLFEIAEGMKYLHDHMICHGNLCPSNIIVDIAHNCYIIDFGLYPIKKIYYNKKDLFNKDYKDPTMNDKGPLLANDVYSYGVLMCQMYLTHFKTQTESLQNIIKISNFSTFGPLFRTLIPKCLNPSIEKRPTFSQIIDIFKTTDAIIGNNIYIKDVYEDFSQKDYIVSLAELNHSDSLIKLGKRYEEGNGVKKDYNKALSYYEKAADLNDSEGQNRYGALLMQDPSRLADGVKFLKLSAENGNIHGMANYGIALKNGTGVSVDIKKAKENLKKAADFGYSKAQLHYGLLMLEKYQTLEEKNEGLNYFQMSIDQCDPDAFYYYGVLLKSGKFYEKNIKLAVEYFKRAADLGNSMAMIEYGDANCNGNVIPINTEVSLKYYKLALENGNEIANLKIESLNKLINNDQRNQPVIKTTNNIHFDEKTPQNDLLMIFKHLKSIQHICQYEEQFIKTNNPLIIYKLGKFFYNEYNSYEDKRKAMNYIHKAADLGLAEAQTFYGIALQKGDCIQKDLNLSLLYFKKAAKQGDINGFYNYGITILNKYDSKKKKEIGLAYIKKAADHDLPVAQYTFGCFTDDKKLGHQYIEKAYKANFIYAFNDYAKNFMKGIGVEQDIRKAADIYCELYEKNKETKILFSICKCLKLFDYSKYLEYLKILADTNDDKYICHIHKAQFQYGLELFKGQNIYKNVDEAIKYFLLSKQEFLIRKEYPEIYSLIPHDFSPVEKDIDAFLNRNDSVNEKEKMLVQSMYNGNADDTLAIAKLIEKTGNFKTANFLLEIAADSNQMNAAFILGKRYRNGEKAIKINVKKGMKYLQRSAALGHQNAQVIIKKIEKLNKIFSEESSSDNEHKNMDENNHNMHINASENQSHKDLSIEISQGISNEHNINDKHESINGSDSRNESQSSDYSDNDEKQNISDESDKDYKEESMNTSNSESESQSSEDSDKDEKQNIFNESSENNEDKSSDESRINESQNITSDSDTENTVSDESNTEIEQKNQNLQDQVNDDFEDKNQYDSNNDESKSDIEQNKSDDSDYVSQSNADSGSSCDKSFSQRSTKILKEKTESIDKNNSNTQLSENKDGLFHNSNDLHQNENNDLNNDLVKDETESHQNENNSFLGIIGSLQDGTKLIQDEEKSKNDEKINKKEQNSEDNESNYSQTNSDFDSDSDSEEQTGNIQMPPDYVLNKLTPNELFEKGEEHYQNLENELAFNYYKLSAEKGMHNAYLKCAELATSFEEKLKYYDLAIHHHVENSFSEWRKSILKHLSLYKQNGAEFNAKANEYARKFERKKDFSDACYLYKKANNIINSQICYEKAKRNTQLIQDGHQQYIFAIILEKHNEIKLAEHMYNKAIKNKISNAKTNKMNMYKNIKPKNEIVERFINNGINSLKNDPEKALQFFSKAKENGSSKADFYIGECYRKMRRYDISINYFKKSAESGDPDGLNSYGDCFKFGRGIAKNSMQAGLYYKLAAEKGNGKGLYNYWYHLKVNSLKTEEEEKEAFSYLQKAAELLVPDALYEYSKAIEETNQEDSQKFFEFSIEIGSEEAIREFGKKLQLQQKFDEAGAFYKKCADKGSFIGSRKYAKYIKKNYKYENDNMNVLEYLRRAAENGEAKDLFKYAHFMYDCFQGKMQNIWAKYFKLAVDEGYPKAYFFYAECLSKGYGVEKNLDEASKYFTLSRQKDPQSPANQCKKDKFK